MKSLTMQAAGLALLMGLSLSLWAQDEPATAMPSADQADANIALLEYHSVFLDYIPFQPAELLPWAEANARVALVSGHAGHGTMAADEHAQHGKGGAK